VAAAVWKGKSFLALFLTWARIFPEAIGSNGRFSHGLIVASFAQSFFADDGGFCFRERLTSFSFSLPGWSAVPYLIFPA